MAEKNTGRTSSNPVKNASSGGDDSATSDASPQTTDKDTGQDPAGGTTERQTATSDPLSDRKDDKGNLIDPPVLPDYEQRLQLAHAAGDDVSIQSITEEYHEAREEHARKLAEAKSEGDDK